MTDLSKPPISAEPEAGTPLAAAPRAQRLAGSRPRALSTIWLTVCASRAMPWSGQRGVPTRANSRRR